MPQSTETLITYRLRVTMLHGQRHEYAIPAYSFTSAIHIMFDNIDREYPGKDRAEIVKIEHNYLGYQEYVP